MINPDSKEWKEHMAAALMAQFVLIPQPIYPQDQSLPCLDDQEETES